MVKKVIVTLFVLGLSGCGFAPSDEPRSSISTLSRFSDFNFDTVEPGAVVLFDVDETLIQPEDTYLINEHTPQGIAFKEKLRAENPDYQDWDEIAGILLTQAKRPLIEPTVLKAIKSIKNRGVNVFAITNMNTGRFSHLKKLESWRHGHLKALGFEGSRSEKMFTIPGFKRSPVFYNGLIATDLEEKGPVLEYVLDKLGISPPEIVMFDDSLEYLQSVAKTCRELKIPFEGYRYKGAKTKPWDEALIRFQADTLMHKKMWVSDHLAKMRLSLK